MPPKLRLLLRIIIILGIIFAAIQPFNWFCQITQKCKPFSISYYLPEKQGQKKIDVRLEVTNYREDLLFSTETPIITTFSNKKNLVHYRIKNLSKKQIFVRPKLVVDPKYAEKYIVKYQCLCMNLYRLKPMEEKDLVMEFKIDRNIESDSQFDHATDNVLKIRYEI